MAHAEATQVPHGGRGRDLGLDRAPGPRYRGLVLLRAYCGFAFRANSRVCGSGPFGCSSGRWRSSRSTKGRSRSGGAPEPSRSPRASPRSSPAHRHVWPRRRGLHLYVTRGTRAQVLELLPPGVGTSRPRGWPPAVHAAWPSAHRSGARDQPEPTRSRSKEHCRHRSITTRLNEYGGLFEGLHDDSRIVSTKPAGWRRWEARDRDGTNVIELPA
jgi:hypothetical protein